MMENDSYCGDVRLRYQMLVEVRHASAHFSLLIRHTLFVS